MVTQLTPLNFNIKFFQVAFKKWCVGSLQMEEKMVKVESDMYPVFKTLIYILKIGISLDLDFLLKYRGSI